MGFQTAFKKLLADIEPSSTSVGKAVKAHTDLRGFLRTHRKYSAVHIDTFLAGSYVRDTALRPSTLAGEKARPDVDVIVETNYRQTTPPHEVLKLLREALGEEYELDKHKNDRSVGVMDGEIDLDVVPIIAPYGASGSLFVPDRRLRIWLPTNPPGHTAWATEVNARAGGRFKPLVKLFKWWRRHNARSKRPKGFIIEKIVADCMDPSNSDYPSLFVETLESIVSRYESYALAGSVPVIPDPSVPGNSVTKRLSVDDFKLFLEEAKKHAILGRKAVEEKDLDAAWVMWQKILPRIPAGGDSPFTNSSVTKAAAPVVLGFPNRPVVPQKPTGFA